ncbi:MAG: gamma-butyrobetaine hydroxylase-like domain-containing protein, partial [Betaproteobacteria bacterium]|nr:gamma-butyrobetaine hydroxylase-like domain-containing protein [Betaproteobacteria bacterium]
IQPTFSDGHATGIYSWDYLYQLGLEQDSRWTSYLKQMDDAGESR